MLSKASFFIPKSSANLNPGTFLDFDKKIDDGALNDAPEETLINIEENEQEKSRDSEQDSISNSHDASLKETFAEDKDDKNILSIQLENWLCSGFK